jgi:hypothetical protein
MRSYALGTVSRRRGTSRSEIYFRQISREGTLLRLQDDNMIRRTQIGQKRSRNDHRVQPLASSSDTLGSHCDQDSFLRHERLGIYRVD